MLPFHTLPFLAASLLAPPLSAQKPLTKYRLLDTDVQANVPAYPSAEPAGEIEYKGWKYEFSPQGALAGRRIGAGGWDELQKLYAARSSPVAEWRAKFVIFSYTDILDHGSDGVLRERRNGFFGPDYKAILNSIALFGTMVEAYSGGKLKFVPEVVDEEQPIRFDVPSETPYSAAFAQHYLAPRVNAGAYMPDDKVYRGPYNSIFLIHSGLTEAECETSVNDMPAAVIPFYYDYDNAHTGELARRMFSHWIRQLTFAARRHGYQLGPMSAPSKIGYHASPEPLRLPEGLISDSMWPAICNLKDTSDYALHGAAKEAAAQPWSKVSAEPWTMCPLTDSGKLSQESGVDQQVVAQALEADSPLRVLKGANESLAICEPEYADFVASDIEGSDLLCAGFAHGANGPKIAFVSAKAIALKVPAMTAAPPSGNGFSFKDADPKLACGGYTSYKVVDDPDQGKAALVEDNWVVRNGWVRLLGGGDSTTTLSARCLDLLLKPVSGSFSIEVVGPNGTASYDIFGSTAAPAEMILPHSKTLGLSPTGGWQHAAIDVADATAVYLTAGNAAYWPVAMVEKAGVPASNKEELQKPSILIGAAHLVDRASPTPAIEPQAVSPDASSSDAGARAAFAAKANEGADTQTKASLLSLLKDDDSTVQLNAAAAFTRIKDKGAESALARLSKNSDSRVAEWAIRALMFQETPTAKAAVGKALEEGPYDANKYYAAVALAPDKDPALEEKYSLLIISRNWETRLAAVQAIAQMPGDNAQKFLLAMLEETNPEIEVQVASLGDPKWDLFEKRMQWYAVNDSSDEMRFTADIALIRSPLPGYPDEGFKGIHDDSYWVRKSLLEYLAAHPVEAARKAIPSALADPEPEVRVAALHALGALGNVAQADLAAAGADKDPRVQQAFAKLQNMKESQR